MIKCVAIDDEPIALSIIREYCGRQADVSLECFSSPAAAMDYIESVRPDIVFMDIEMNSHNGLELARRLPEGTCLIFTTAYSQYALDGFNVDAVDFLHKPIFYSRFERAMQKARAWLSLRSRPAGASRDIITLKVEHRTVVVDLADILYIEAMDNYVKIFRRNMPMVLSQITMKQTVAMLPPERFIRVHRSYIVARDAVESYSNRMITLRDTDRTVPVGRKYAQEFYDALTKQLTTK